MIITVDFSLEIDLIEFFKIIDDKFKFLQKKLGTFKNSGQKQ